MNLINANISTQISTSNTGTHFVINSTFDNYKVLHEIFVMIINTQVTLSQIYIYVYIINQEFQVWITI